jgi:hypothetical protein
LDHLRDRYDDLWRSFRELERVRPTLAGWRGRHRRAALVVKVNDPTLFRRLDRIRHALAGLRFVVPVPDHGLYVPLVELGPVALRGARAGELLRGRLPDRAAAMRALVTRTPPITVDVNRVNACPTEVFAELHRSAPLVTLQAQLRAALELEDDWLPRLPLAHFAAEGDAAALARAIDWFRDRPIGPIRIGSVLLVVRHGRRLNPWVERVEEVPLGG